MNCGWDREDTFQHAARGHAKFPKGWFQAMPQERLKCNGGYLADVSLGKYIL